MFRKGGQRGKDVEVISPLSTSLPRRGQRTTWLQGRLEAHRKNWCRRWRGGRGQVGRGGRRERSLVNPQFQPSMVSGVQEA